MSRAKNFNVSSMSKIGSSALTSWSAGVVSRILQRLTSAFHSLSPSDRLHLVEALVAFDIIAEIGEAAAAAGTPFDFPARPLLLP